jgi:ribosomal subunit interface protein
MVNTMKITITGKQMKVGSALQEYVKENVEVSIKKYFENAISAHVTFSKETHLFVTDIVVNEGVSNQLYYKSQAKEDNVYACFDRALDRMEKQLRRYKRRIKDHHKQGVGEATALAAMKYVISDDGQDFEESSEIDNPLIIAEKQTAIESLTVADAVMRMNLANLPALVFINKKTSNFNVVYKRLDGNISWIDSKHEASMTKDSPKLKAVN